MGQKTKGGMWCAYCEKRVLGIRNTSRARDTAATLLAPVTGGASTFAWKTGEGYACNTCGSPVSRAQGGAPPVPPAAKPRPDVIKMERLWSCSCGKENRDLYKVCTTCKRPRSPGDPTRAQVVEPEAPTLSAETSDPLAALGRLGELREAGLVTDEEFEAKKAELLRRI